MKNKCYWLVDLNNIDEDMFWYTDEDHEIGDMVFIWDDEEDDVGSWLDCYAEHYKTESQMEKGHDRICSNLEKYLKEGAKKCSKQ